MRKIVSVIGEPGTGKTTLFRKFIEKYKEWHETLLIGIRSVFANSKDPEAFAYTLMLIIDGLVVQEVLLNNSFDENRLVRFMMDLGEK